MQAFKTTFPRANTAIAAFPFGVHSGVSLETTRKAAKALRNLREKCDELKEALQLKQKNLAEEKKKAEGNEELLKVINEQYELFKAEVEGANKEPLEVESTKENIQALKEVLSKIDWTSPDFKHKDKEGKVQFTFSGVDVMNLDELMEDLETAKDK